MIPLRHLCLLTAVALAPCIGAVGPESNRFSMVDVAPVKTSIYLGSVSLSADRFSRRGVTYVSHYTARVFPYFFYNEDGQLQVDISDDALLTLAAGSPIDFKGWAIRSDGRRRPVDGRVTPLNSTSGKLKVRIVANRYITLIFNTVYHFHVDSARAQRAGLPAVHSQ